MAQYSQPWDGTALGDAALRSPYNASEWDDMWEAWFGSDANHGVLPGVEGELEVTGAATPLAVAAGGALVKGKHFRSTAAEGITVPSPAGATRTDYIVLRSCWASTGDCGQTTHPGSADVCGPYKIRICLKQNPVEGSGVPPALVQTDGVEWEIPLAEIAITVGGVITVTDARRFLKNTVYDRFWSTNDFETDDGASLDTLNNRWEFDSAVGEGIVTWWRCPDFVRGNMIHCTLYWCGTVLAVPPNDVVVWNVLLGRFDCGSSLAAHWDIEFVTDTVHGVADGAEIMVCDDFPDIDIGWDEDWHGQIVCILVTRQAADPADNYPNDADVIGLRLRVS